MSAGRAQCEQVCDSPSVSSASQATDSLPPPPPASSQDNGRGRVIGWLDGGWTDRNWVSAKDHTLGAQAPVACHGVRPGNGIFIA